MIKVILKETKIKLFTDPDYFGAEVEDDAGEGLPVVNLNVDQITGFEPEEKMEQPEAKAHVDKLLKKLQDGEELDPILVRVYKSGFQVLDGHHRFRAYKLLNKKTIPAKVIPAKDIKVIKHKGENR
jgi:hypothetical protein